MLQYFVFVGAAASLFGVSFYIRDTLRGDTKPNSVTWFMWAVAPLIATAAALTDGVTWAALPVFMSGFAPLLVFICSFVNKNAYWKLGTLDYFCGGLSLLALVLWGITKEPAVAITFAIGSDGLAAFPTLVKSWKYPETESGIVYSTGLFNILTSFFAIRRWAFSEYAFPIYLVIAHLLLLFAVYRRKLFRTT